MKTLKEHNDKKLGTEIILSMADVACDKCGEEMHFTGISLTSMPLKQQVKCEACGYVGAMV